MDPQSADRTARLFNGKPVIAFRDEMERRRFLRGAALVGVGGALTYAAKNDPVSFAQSESGGDMDILQFALTLEQLEAEFYKQGLAKGILADRELALVTPIGDHERKHVEAVGQTITDMGGTPADAPQFRLPAEVFANRNAFLTNASTFEELGVTAYQGQVPLIQSPDVLKAAASIAGVESRHAAVIAQLLDADPFPAVIEKSRSKQEVLSAAAPFLPA